MGTDDESVTDPLTMRVHGVDGLRVVDASAMRYVTNGNIYAPVMMLAEKAADLIAGNTPLPPADDAVLPPRDVAARGSVPSTVTRSFSPPSVAGSGRSGRLSAATMMPSAASRPGRREPVRRPWTWMAATTSPLASAMPAATELMPIANSSWTQA